MGFVCVDVMLIGTPRFHKKALAEVTRHWKLPFFQPMSPDSDLANTGEMAGDRLPWVCHPKGSRFKLDREILVLGVFYFYSSPLPRM